MRRVFRSPVRRGPRILAWTAAMMLFAVGTVLAVAAPAQAATCGSGTTISWSAPVAATSFNWALCSDHSVVIRNGTISDNNCDGRSAQISFYTQYQNAANGTWMPSGYGGTFYHTGGCGGFSTIRNSTIQPARDCATCTHRLQYVLEACGASCSSNYVSNSLYWY